MSIYTEIQDRHARRRQIEREVSGLKPPSIHSKASRQDFNKIIGAKTDEFNEQSLLVTHDFQVIQVALANIAFNNPIDIEAYIKDAWDQTPMAEDKRQALDLIAVEEAEAREKAAKSDRKQGELDGQLKIFDDGSTAEGGDVTVRGLHDDITPESHRLPDYGNLSDQPVDVTVEEVELPGREVTEEEFANLPGDDVTEEALDNDIANAKAKKKTTTKAARPKKK